MVKANATAPAAVGESTGVKSAERTVRILEALASSERPVSLGELHQRTGYPRSSLHALVRTLRDLGWVESDSAGTKFRVGAHALLAGTAYLDRDPAIAYANEALEDLREELGHTVHFARRDEGHVLYLASRESRRGAQLIARVGRRLPLHVTALGQALLAELMTTEVTALMPEHLPGLTDKSITRRSDLLTELEAVRRRGFALEIGQGTPGITCVAAVVSYRIPATDAISCSMPSDVAVGDELVRVQEAVMARSERLGRELRRAGIR